ncbi:magnesium transporter [Kwoniella heveanensis CBS 569]|nr:magnesium transporter [Kwoniella heveanensis CBS 569]
MHATRSLANVVHCKAGPSTSTITLRSRPQVRVRNHRSSTTIALPSLPLVPPLQCRCQVRSLSTKRWTSFWTHSFPSSSAPATATISQAQVPSLPPSPPDAQGHGPSYASDMAGPGSGPGLGRPTGKRDGKQRYLDSLMDKAGELSLRCSVLDAEGNWTAEEGRYKKTELCREHDLDPRDLRKLDSLAPNLVPIILTRKSCILISILNIRALIKPDRVIVFDIAGTQENEVQRRFKYHLERNIKAGLGIVKGEDGALESILVATANALEEEMAFTRQLVQHLLSELEDDINRDNLRRLLHYSRRIVGFQSRARYVRRAVDELLESDEDLSAMYLTSRAQGRPRALHDHEQLELLLESFVKQVEEIVSEVDTTVANMNSTQEIAELMLDSGRNELLALDIKISIATLGIGTGALVAGLFGMNLTTQLESSPYAFLAVSGAASAIALLVVMFGSRTLRRVRRVALTGRRPSALSQMMASKRWDSSVAQFSQGFDPALVDKRAEMAKRAIWDRLFWRRMKSTSGAAGVWASRGGRSSSNSNSSGHTPQRDRLASTGKVGMWTSGDLKAMSDRWRYAEEEKNRRIAARFEKEAERLRGGEEWYPEAGMDHGIWKWGKGFGEAGRLSRR